MVNKKNLENKEYKKLINTGLHESINKNYVIAEELFKKAILVNKNNYEGYLNLANIYVSQNKILDAVKILKEYLNSNLFNEKIANNLGVIFLNYKLDNELKNLFKLFSNKNNSKEKNKYYLFFLQGKYFEKNSEFDNALKSYKISTNLNKHFIQSYISILDLLEKRNKIEEFKIFVEYSIRYFPDEPRIKFYEILYLSRANHFKKSIKKIYEYNLIKKLKFEDFFYIRLLDILSKNYEKIKDYNNAFENISKRNHYILNLPSTSKFNENKIFETLKVYKIFFNSFYSKRIFKTPKHKNLVFLVGFPRSGTTLLDTILRSHSKTLVLEEKPYLLDIRHFFFKKNNKSVESINNLDLNTIRELQKKYFEKIKKNNHKKLIIDKFPLSIIEIGFIKSIFPNSKIILTVRHPCDVILSCYFTHFKINEAMKIFLDLDKSINLYNEVFSLFEIYEEKLKLDFHLIKYEDLVSNFKPTLKNLLKYLDLNYEDNIENFYETALKRDKIFTPSYNQVINPIYNTSMNKWINYKEISEKKPKLDYWIKKFGY